MDSPSPMLTHERTVIGSGTRTATVERYPAVILTVRMSSDTANLHAAAGYLASRLETAASVQGSTLIPFSGRWNGATEPGMALEMAVPLSRYAMRADAMYAELAAFRATFDLTLYVTTAAIDAAEVY